MNKKILNFFLLYRISKKVTLIVFVIFSILLLLFLNINLELKNYNYYVPKNFAYTEVSNKNINSITTNVEQKNIQYLTTTPLTEYYIPQSPYENKFELPIENIDYKDGGKEMVIINQNLINDGEKVRKFPIGYLNLPTTLIREDININIDTLNIKRILVGNFPQKNEAIIGENLANYYLDVYNLHDYSELVGENLELTVKLNGKELIQEYEISGVYQINDDYSPDLIDEWIFVNPNDNNNFKYYNDILGKKDKKGLFLVFDTKDSMLSYINSSNYEWLTYKNIPWHNYKKYVNIIIIILLNIILYLLFLKEIKYIRNILLVYNIEFINYLIIFTSPFIILNIIILLIVSST